MEKTRYDRHRPSASRSDRSTRRDPVGRARESDSHRGGAVVAVHAPPRGYRTITQYPLSSARRAMSRMAGESRAHQCDRRRERCPRMPDRPNKRRRVMSPTPTRNLGAIVRPVDLPVARTQRGAPSVQSGAADLASLK